MARGDRLSPGAFLHAAWLVERNFPKAELHPSLCLLLVPFVPLVRFFSPPLLLMLWEEPATMALHGA